MANIVDPLFHILLAAREVAANVQAHTQQEQEYLDKLALALNQYRSWQRQLLLEQEQEEIRAHGE